jgi:hypothetical protein
MSKTNPAIAVLALILAAACVLFFRQVRVERDRSERLEAQVTQLQRELNAPQPRPPEQQESAPSSQPPGPAPAAASASATSSSSSAHSKPADTKPPEHLVHWRQLLADPAYRDAMRVQHRMQLEPQRADIASALGLSPDETDRFLDLLAEHSIRDNEYSTKAQLAGDDQNSEEWQRKYRERHDQLRSERKAFLGQERFRRWTEYVDSAGARAQIRELRAQLATSTSPLRDDQATPLIAALAAEQRRHAAERQQHHGGAQWTDETPAAERIAYMERRAELIEESLERSREAGAMYLDSEQQRRFDEMLERQREQARAELEMWRASQKAEKRLRSASGSR